MSEGIELRVRAPQRGDSERLLSAEEEGDFDEEGGVAGAGVGHQDGLDWERDHEDDDDASGGDLLRDIDSKRKKRNVAEPYYYQSQRKVPPLSPHDEKVTFFIHPQGMPFCWCGGGAGGDRGAGGARDDPAGAAERDGRIQDGSS
jgi:hypothetical protein